VKSNLTIEQGATFSRGWLVRLNGSPIDDTWSARGQIRNRIGGSLLHDLAPSVNADGSVVFAIEDTVSSAWDWRKGVYDIETVNADESIVLRVAEGSVTIKPEVTR
jgi:hypothetical protein